MRWPAKSGAHLHAGSVFAYMLSGAIRSENSAIGPVKVYNRLLKNAMQQLNSGARKHSGSAMGGSLEHHELLNAQFGSGQRGEEVPLSPTLPCAHATATSVRIGPSCTPRPQR